MKFMEVSGWFHVHSDFSFDGTKSIEEIISQVSPEGYRFLALAEHVPGLDEEVFAEYLDCCKSASTEELVVIPGLEVISEFDLEILALGIDRWIGPGPLRTVIDAVHDAGGLAVLAHPYGWNPDFYLSIQSALADLHGVEVWNHRRDGDSGENPGALKLLDHLRQANEGMLAFGGMDYHGPYKGRDLVTIAEPEVLTEEAVVSALKAGRFRFGKGALRGDRSVLGDLARWMFGKG